MAPEVCEMAVCPEGERIARMEEKLDRLLSVIEGNGKPSLPIRLDRLEVAHEGEKEKRRSTERNMWAIFVPLILLVIKAAWDWLSAGRP